MTLDYCFYLHEELYLLALRDPRVTRAARRHAVYALAGAVIAELLVARRITIEDGRARLINVLNLDPTGDSVLDTYLRRIAAARRRAGIGAWLKRWTKERRLPHAIAQQLCKRGVLVHARQRVMGLVSRDIYGQAEPEAQQYVLDKVYHAIFAEETPQDPRTIMLLSLADAAGMLKAVFRTATLKPRRPHIRRVIRGDVVAAAARQAIRTTLIIQAAIASLLAARVA